MVAALKSEWVAAFKSAYPAGFVGIRMAGQPPAFPAKISPSACACGWLAL
jgi:hypothetical protein